MFKVVDIQFKEFYSQEITQKLLTKYLLGNKCNEAGILTLTLTTGRKLKQQGPYLIPPIRWLYSFEDVAEFVIICECARVDDNE